MNNRALIHESNLRQKETHLTKYRDATSRKYLTEIRSRYDNWNGANEALIGPLIARSDLDSKIIADRVELFEQYKEFLDQQHYAEQFDSRSNLHSSALEQFLYYLFRDLVADFGPNALIGKSHTFKDMFFAPPSYTDLLRHPHAVIEKKDHDFIIGATIEATFKASVPIETADDVADDGEEETTALLMEKPTDYDQPTMTTEAETHIFDIPAIAVECKTYLDKTMLEASSRAVEELKARFPDGLYIVVSEWIKLSGRVNLKKYKLDQIYVLRKQKNTDREYRYLDGYTKNPIDVETVQHLFDKVRVHLSGSSSVNLDTRISRGWLIDE